MNTCYDCLHLRCKIPVNNSKLLYKQAVAWCRKGNLTKSDILQTRYWQHVIPEIPKLAFKMAERCIDFDDMRGD